MVRRKKVAKTFNGRDSVRNVILIASHSSTPSPTNPRLSRRLEWTGPGLRGPVPDCGTHRSSPPSTIPIRHARYRGAFALRRAPTRTHPSAMVRHARFSLTDPDHMSAGRLGPKDGVEGKYAGHFCLGHAQRRRDF